VSDLHNMVSHSRARWEDSMNASFERSKSPERVCWHPDVTAATDTGPLIRLDCDYCPAFSIGVIVQIPTPWYFKDDDPLRL